jgi:DnaK suppressor protein
MAEKKKSTKAASEKDAAKPAAKPKKAAAAGKTAAKPEKKASPKAEAAEKVKKASPKAAAPAKAKKASPKAAAPDKAKEASPKAAAPAKAKKVLPKSDAADADRVEKAVVKSSESVPALGQAKPSAPPAKPMTGPGSKAKAPLVARSKSSVVDFPAPPPPVKPPFVPPKPALEAPASSGTNGSHSASFIQKQRQRLLDLRDDLVDAMSGMTRDTIRNAPEGSEASGSGMHQGDAGSDAYDRDFALSVLAKEQDALYEIEQALRRIDKGSYGICEMSSRKIPQTRLEAIPFARLTVECQAQWEKEYGNRRFRPSNEVGFSGGKHVDDEDSESVSLDEDDD